MSIRQHLCRSAPIPLSSPPNSKNHTLSEYALCQSNSPLSNHPIEFKRKNQSVQSMSKLYIQRHGACARQLTDMDTHREFCRTAFACRDFWNNLGRHFSQRKNHARNVGRMRNYTAWNRPVQWQIQRLVDEETKIGVNQTAVRHLFQL